MARKNDTNKLPFSQKLFYLDVTSNITLKSKIEFCVKQLGGTIETFLDRKVRYVVTDKPIKDWPATAKEKLNKFNKLDPSIHPAKRQATGQPANNANNKSSDVPKLEFMGLTRGKMLLASKAPQSSSNKTKDVLETAVKLNMKILTHRSILDFCKKFIKISVDDMNTCEQSNEVDNSVNNSKVKVKQLKTPFLKFEDKEERFAPVYKEFEMWPSVCVDANSSIVTTTNQQTPNVPKNFNTKLIQPITKKRQRVFFCEICSKEFTNMIEHVQTDQHQDYMKNEENYKELRSVIDSLPNWITLNDTSAFDENEEFTDEESEFEDEFSDEYDDDAYSSESKETVLSEEEVNQNSEHCVPPSFRTPVKMFKLNNIFNNITE